MTDLTSRLKTCFSAVFPKLSDAELTHASLESLPGWDSLATVTLVGVIEEEFAISVDVDDLIEFQSFNHIRNLLEKKTAGRHAS